jgi:hypothetical protein
MPELVTLEEDGPFGKAGDQVWVNDPADVKPAKKPAAKKALQGGCHRHWASCGGCRR